MCPLAASRRGGVRGEQKAVPHAARAPPGAGAAVPGHQPLRARDGARGLRLGGAQEGPGDPPEAAARRDPGVRHRAEGGGAALRETAARAPRARRRVSRRRGNERVFAGGPKASKALEGARKDVRDGDDHDALPDDEAPSGLDAFGADVADDAGEQDIPWGEDVDADAAALAADTDDFDDDFDDSGSDVSEEDDVVVRGGEGVTPEAAAEAEAAWRARTPTSVAARARTRTGRAHRGRGTCTSCLCTRCCLRTCRKRLRSAAAGRARGGGGHQRRRDLAHHPRRALRRRLRPREERVFGASSEREAAPRTPPRRARA